MAVNPVTLLGALVLLLFSAWPGEAWAQKAISGGGRLFPRGKQCLGEPEPRWYVAHSIVGSINPLGLENRFYFTYCRPFTDRPGVLFDFANIEAGVVNYTSPAHLHLGGFLSFAPLSVLVLRAEMTGFFIWPLNLQGAGYIPLPDDKNFTIDTLSPPAGSASEAGRGYGARALLGVTLQGAVPMGKHADLALVNAFEAEWWRHQGIDRHLEYVYAARRDVLLRASSDFVLGNTAALVAMIKPHANYVVRVGVMDDLVYVPRSGYLGNLVAGILAGMIRDVGGLVYNLQLFIRAGAATDHAFRSGFSMGGGLSAAFDLKRRR